MSQAMPSQVVVLSRGLELSGQPTQPTRERALSAAYYYKEYGADLVVFAGGLSFLSDNMGFSQNGEHLVMAEIAESSGLPADVIRVPEPSDSTVANFITSIPHIRPFEDIGVIAHSDHLPRGLFLGNLILPNPQVIGIEAFGSYNAGAVRQEQLLLIASKLIFAGVAKGDLKKVEARNSLLESTAKALKPALRLLMRNNAIYNI